MTYKWNLNLEVGIPLFHQVPNLSFEIDIMDVLARDGGEGVRYAMVAIGISLKLQK